MFKVTNKQKNIDLKHGILIRKKWIERLKQEREDKSQTFYGVLLTVAHELEMVDIKLTPKRDLRGYIPYYLLNSVAKGETTTIAFMDEWDRGKDKDGVLDKEEMRLSSYLISREKICDLQRKVIGEMGEYRQDQEKFNNLLDNVMASHRQEVKGREVVHLSLCLDYQFSLGAMAVILDNLL